MLVTDTRGINWRTWSSRDCAETARCPVCREGIGYPCHFLNDSMPWYPDHYGPQYHHDRLVAAEQMPGIPARVARLRELAQMSQLTLLSLALRDFDWQSGHKPVPQNRDSLIAFLLP